MARAHRVAKSRKEYKCHAGHVIPVGEPYSWAKPGFRTRTKKYACGRHPFRESQLTSSMRAEGLAAIEAFEDEVVSVASFEDLEAARSNLEQALSDYLAMREEGLEAWENGNSQLEELRDIAQEALSTVESYQIDEPGEPDDDELASAGYDANEFTDRDEIVQMWLDERLAEARDEMVDEFSGLEV